VRWCRLAADHALLLTEAGQEEAVREALAVRGKEGYVTDVTSVLAGLALVGPRAREIMRKLTALNVESVALPDGACAETGVAGVHAVLLRADLGELPAYEIYVTRDVAEFVWDTLLDAGREYGLTPLGLSAYRALSDPSNETAAEH
jgi:heterotetrameric sarcosine oxidase gamma subunit